MTPRITCYVVLVTLIWGASAQNEEKLRDILQTNMTRNDFSNLLKSLIKLNEQRVNVLHKLYRLEDYGVLSEVLRSGDKKTSNGNLNNLFLVVLSKNETNPSRRNMGIQVVDSVPSISNRSINVKITDKRSNNYPKKEHVLEPAGGSYTLPLKQNQLKLNIKDNPKVLRAKNRFEIDDGTHTFSSTIKSIQFTYTKHRNSGHKNVEEENGTSLHIVRDTPKGNYKDKRNNKEAQGRFEIVSNGGSLINTSREVSEYDDDDNNSNYSPIPGDNSQSNQYPDLDISTENDHITKLIKIKDIIANEHKNSKFHKKDELDNDHNKFTSLSVEKSGENYHNKKYHKINKDITNEEDNGDKKYNINRGNPNENGYNNKNSNINKDISNENDHSNMYPKIKKDGSDEYYHGIKHPKLKSNENSHSDTHPNMNNKNDHPNKNSKINADQSNENDHRINLDSDDHRINLNDHDHRINLNDNDHRIYSNENDHRINVNDHRINNGDDTNDHNSKYSNINRDASKETYHHGNNNPNSNKENDHDNKYSNINRDKEIDHGNQYPKMPKDDIENDRGNKRPKEPRDNSKEDKPITVKNLSYEHNHGNKKPKMGKEFDRGDYDAYGKTSLEDYGGGGNAHINPGRGRSHENKDEYPNNESEQPESKPESRKNFQKCISKKALKLCTKSCISAYKNVCRRLKCTSRSKKALKKECKKSCKKTFSSSSSSSKYSNEDRS